MSSKTLIKELAQWRCQICGDDDGKSYESGVVSRLEAHHVIPKSQGGERKLHNLVAVCDLCHAVVTPQRWEEHFGLIKNRIPRSEMERLSHIYEEFMSEILRWNRQYLDDVKMGI